MVVSYKFYKTKDQIILFKLTLMQKKSEKPI